MTPRAAHRRWALLLTLLAAFGSMTAAWAAFSSHGKTAVAASVTLGGGAAPALTINALPLAPEVFGGKNFVIPIQVVSSAGPISTTTVRVDLVYQLRDAQGADLTAPTVVVPFHLSPDPDHPERMPGTVLIARTALQAIQSGGQLKYFFRAFQNNAGLYLGGGSGAAGAPYALGTNAPTSAEMNNFAYTSTVVTDFELPVKAAGSASFAADTFENDGQTGLSLDPGAIANDGVLRIEQLDLARVPSGPGGTRPTVAYNFSLLGTTLQKSGRMVLSYPADLNGQISDSGDNPANLAPYWWDGVAWRLLSRPKIDTTLHTVTGYLPPPGDGAGRPAVASAASPTLLSNVSAQFEGSFALFPAGAGASGAAALRPAERIITPNGDGINDVATFSGLTDGDTVHIFDVRGRRVRTIHAAAATATQWDGRDDGGSIVASGVYLYQFTSQGEQVSGVIAVAK